MSDEDAFALCNKAVVEGECNDKRQSTHDFDITRQPYTLEFKNTQGVYNMCKLCNQSRCNGCLVPYSNETVEANLDKMALIRNDTLFGNRYYSGKELVCNITWHGSIMGNLFDFLATAEAGTKLQSAQADDEADSNNNG